MRVVCIFFNGFEVDVGEDDFGVGSVCFDISGFVRVSSVRVVFGIRFVGLVDGVCVVELEYVDVELLVMLMLFCLSFMFLEELFMLF